MEVLARNGNATNANQYTLLQLIQQNKLISRTELAHYTNLTQAAVSKIISRLIDQHIVEEVEVSSTQRGRHAMGLRIAAHYYKVIAIKITRDSVMVGIFGIDGSMQQQQTLFDSLNLGPDIIMNEIHRRVMEYYREDFDHRIIAVGVAIAGPYYTNSDQLFLSGESKWDNIHIRAYLQKNLPLPVFIEHDAKAGLLAELYFGDISSESRVLGTIVMNQGLGAGVAINGKIVEGFQGDAGEIGHISVDINGPRCSCGNRGCLEMRCTTIAVIKKARELAQHYPNSSIIDPDALTFRDLLSAYHARDPLAVAAAEYLAESVAVAAQILICTYNPDHIILCDKLQPFGATFSNLVMQELSTRVRPQVLNGLILRCSTLPFDAALYGAASVAIKNIMIAPIQFLP